MSDLAGTLAELAQRGLLARITRLKVGDVEVEMLHGMVRQPMDMDKASDAQKQLDEDILFGSS